MRGNRIQLFVRADNRVEQGANMEKLISFISNNIRRIFDFSILVKLVFSAAVGMVASNGFFGFFFAMATHKYAKYFGIRVPVEGTDYEILALQIARPQILIMAALLGIATFYSFRWVTKIRSDVVEMSASHPLQEKKELAQELLWLGKKLGSLGKKGTVFAVLVFALLAFGAMWILSSYLFEPLLCNNYMHHAICGKVLEFSLSFGAFVGVVGLLILNASYLWWVTTGVSMWFVGTAIFNHFDPNTYAKYLRIHGYGGGLMITIRTSNESASAEIEKSGYLLLRTSTTVFIYDYAQERIDEIPLQKIENLSYAAGGLGALGYKLPSLPAFVDQRNR